MARAKRTDRSEARRLHRERLREEMEAAAELEGSEDGEPTVGIGKMRSAHDRPGRSGEFANPVGRQGMAASAKAAFRQPHYLDDIKSLPQLVLKSYAVWPIAAIVLVALAFSYARVNKDTTLTNDPIISTSYQFILNPVPTLMPMLAGYLAPRATWLAGALAAGMGTLGAIALVTGADLKVLGGTQVRATDIVPLVGFSMVLGSLLGAASGWYKRFLQGMQATSPRRTSPRVAAAQRTATRRKTSGR